MNPEKDCLSQIKQWIILAEEFDEKFQERQDEAYKRKMGEIQYNKHHNRYFFEEIELDPNHPEAWGSLIMATVAKKTLEESLKNGN